MEEVSQFRSAPSRYGLAVLFVMVAAVFRYSLTPVIGSITPLLFFTVAQVAAALLTGRGPGLLAVFFGTAIGSYLFLEPAGGLSGAVKIYYILLNICVGVALVWMVDSMHRTQKESRRNDEELRAWHQRMTDLLARIGDSFFSFDLEWKCLYANPRACVLTGKDWGEIEGKTFQELLPGIFTAPRAALLQRAVEQRAYLALDGFAEPQGIWFEMSIYPGADAISVFIRDVTDRKRAQTAITRSEQHFRRIFDENPVGMTIVGMDGKFRRVNNAMCRMMEYSEAELVGMSTVDVTPPEDLEVSGFYSQRQQALVTGRIEHLQMEKRFVTKSGKVVWTNLNASILRESDDQRYFLGIIENITERKQVEQQLRESQKLESLGVLAGGIAHDFNNLLTGILGNASLGLDLTPDDSPLRTLLERLVNASEKAADLTRQLLAYAGKGRFVLKALDLSETVEEISSLVRANFPGHVRLDLQLAPELPPIEADPAQIQQVIMNLMLNAAESIPLDRTGVVKVGTQEFMASDEDLLGTFSGTPPQPGSYVMLEVSDNGSGMVPETQARIFEPFFTTKFTGRGLGLSAVLGIVASYHGAVSVESQVGTGSRFRVLLPAAAKGLLTVPDSTEAPRAAATILVVDEAPLVLAMARTALEMAGFMVLVAESGIQAEEIMNRKAGDIEAVILDMTMANGEETFEHLKAVRADVAVIVCSGLSEPDIASRLPGARVAGFLQKPYTASQLVDAANSIIRAALRPGEGANNLHRSARS